MEFSVNPQAMFGLSFSIPAVVTDKHLKLAGSAQLKVLLWLLRHMSEEHSTAALCEALRMSPADATDAMQYWVEAGIVLADSESVTVQPAAIFSAPAAAAESVQPQLAPLPESRPTGEQIVKRASESEEIRFMLNEAQVKLGRTLGYDSQSTLLMIHDTYGLPVEVLLMLIEYCVSIGKDSLNYISKVAKDWGEREIDSLEKADEQIRALRRCDGLWKKIRELTGIQTPRPTAAQSKYLHSWSGEMGFTIDMIYLGYEEMANHTEKLNFPYWNKVLQNWHDNGLKTPKDVEDANAKFLAEKDGKKPEKLKKQKGYEASYNIDEFNRQSLTAPPVYKKEKDEE